MDKNGRCWHCKIVHSSSEKNISYSDYLKTEHWKNVKRRFFEGKMKKKCFICGSKNNLNLHHRTYNHLWKERISVHLNYLCRQCHVNVHFQGGKTPLKWEYLMRKQRRLIRIFRKKKKLSKLRSPAHTGQWEYGRPTD